jgi:diguanylate cyclase (GGDEF)-like protein/PAS domain S-box-containing protein
LQLSAFGAGQDATPELPWENQERFQRAFDDAAIGMLIAGLDGRFLEVNGALCTMLGRSERELLRSSFFEITFPEDRASSQEAMRRMLAGEARAFNLELRYVDRSGEPLWVQTHVSLTCDAHGRPLYLIGQIQDVSAQKHAEEELRQALAKYRTLVEQIPASTYITAADDVGTLLYQSPQIGRLFGYSPDEWLATPSAWQDHIHPDDRERVMASDAQASASGDAYCLEYRFFTRDGRTVWVRDEGQLVRDSLGEPVCWQGISIDITRQKEAEEQLRMQQALLTALTESSLDGIAVLSDTGTVLATNEQFRKLWNFPDGAIVGSSSAALHAHCVAQVADQGAAQANVDELNRQRDVSEQRELLLKDGRTLDRFTSPVAGSHGEYYGRVWYYRDSTERSRMERDLRAREAQLAEAQRLAGLGSWAWDAVTNEARWSDEGYRLLGLAPGEVEPNLDVFLGLVHPDQREQVERAISAALEHGTGYQLDITVCRPDGTERILQALGEVVTDPHGAPLGLRGTMLDVTERRLLEARLAHQALQDPLTGLPNRRCLSERLDAALARSRENGGRVGLLFLDLDNFKAVNDELGHDAGDDVLIEVAERLRRDLRGQDSVARLGGDEFVVLLEEVDEIGTAIAVAERILATVKEPIQTGLESCRLTASVGIMLSEAATADAEELLRGSDAAMYTAKSRGKARWVADSSSPQS